MPEYKLKLTRVGTTKNTSKFDEVVAPGKPAVIGALYVQKWAAGEAEELDVTVKVGK